MGIFKVKKAWKDALQTLRYHLCQTRLTTIAFNHNRWRKNHCKVKQNLNKYLSTNSALQKAIEGKLQPEEVNHTQENTRNIQSLTRKSKEGK